MKKFLSRFWTFCYTFLPIAYVLCSASFRQQSLSAILFFPMLGILYYIAYQTAEDYEVMEWDEAENVWNSVQLNIGFRIGLVVTCLGGLGWREQPVILAGLIILAIVTGWPPFTAFLSMIGSGIRKPAPPKQKRNSRPKSAEERPAECVAPASASAMLPSSNVFALNPNGGIASAEPPVPESAPQVARPRTRTKADLEEYE